MLKRLADLEDILFNQYGRRYITPERLRELVAADVDKRCVVLPCKTAGGSKMIILDDEWRLDVDGQCYMLFKETISKKGKCTGTTTRSPYTFYSSLGAALKQYAAKTDREAIQGYDLTIANLLEILDARERRINEIVNRLDNSSQK